MFIRGKSRYIRGTNNSLSDDSGQKYKRKDMRLTWDNKLVGADEWDAKQPQLTIRPRPDSPDIRDQTRVGNRNQTLAVPSFSPASQVLKADVLDSDGNDFLLPNIALDSDNNSFQINAGAVDSDGNVFAVFTYR